jgi:AraC-like DNA-binding protein
MAQQNDLAESVTFRVGPLVNLASVVESLGYDPAPIFKKEGFDTDDFTNPDHRLPYIRGSQLLARCVKTTGCQTIGFMLGQLANPSHLGLVGFLVRAAPTTELALKALVEFIDLHDQAGSVRLDVDPDYSVLSFALHLPGVEAVDQISDLSAVMLFKIMQGFCSSDWMPSAVKLVRREPPNREVFQRYFRTTIFFNSTETSITFSSHCLAKKPPNADELLYGYLKKRAEIRHDVQHHELIDDLPGALVKGLLTDRYAAHQIADMFGIGERTLHRRLKCADTNFRKELDLARKSVSEQLLGSTSLPICDIAGSLGYADSSGFIRAFHRWTGTNPSSWRKRFGNLK